MKQYSDKKILVSFGFILFLVIFLNPISAKAIGGITISAGSTSINTSQTMTISVVTDFWYSRSNKEVSFKANTAVPGAKFTPNPCILKFPTIGAGKCTVEFSATAGGAVDIVASSSDATSNVLKINVTNVVSTPPVVTTPPDPANTSPVPDPANSTIQSGQSASRVTDMPLRIKLKNPLKVNTLQEAISLFMDAVIKIAIPFIVVFLIWSGLKFILARGNPKELETAKKTFWYTVIGALLILGAWAITDAIVGTINSIAS